MSALLDVLIPVAHAQSGASASQPSLLGALWPLFVLIPFFYFVVLRPQMKRSRETKDMLGKLAKGDEVVTSGGLAGRVTAIGENYLSVEIANQVEVKIQKGAVSSVLPKGTLKAL